ncbi:hypothetical protein DE146DRAFT_635960 [Phaeosphaeria sp. MPI-PUGE-AT-0046c]|nr:hypothetical protein DE146DRAFT_635960 [Phaeosphaeria sp. MPI-PUGE-AT-0046c]
MSSLRTAAEADAIFELNRSVSPLLRLPRELRDAICAFAVGGNNIRYAARLSTYDPETPPHSRFEAWSPAEADKPRGAFGELPLQGPLQVMTLLSLQSASRQLHAEIGLLVFALNTFDFSGWEGRHLLQALPQNGRDVVTTILIEPTKLILPMRVWVVNIHENLSALQMMGVLRSLRKIETEPPTREPEKVVRELEVMAEVIERYTNLKVTVIANHFYYPRTRLSKTAAVRSRLRVLIMGIFTGFWAGRSRFRGRRHP